MPTSTATDEEKTTTAERPFVLCFLSGKGGAGKTATAIGLWGLLIHMGKSCLFVDFDMATEGATSFLEEHKKHKGVRFDWPAASLLEMLPDYRGASHADRKSGYERNQKTIRPMSEAIAECIVEIDRKAYVAVAKRPKIRITESMTSASTDRDVLVEAVEYLLAWAQMNHVEYVVIDCQAGIQPAAMAAYMKCDRPIFTTEEDLVSRNASEFAKQAATHFEQSLAAGTTESSKQGSTSLNRLEPFFLVTKLDPDPGQVDPRFTSSWQFVPFDEGMRRKYGEGCLPFRHDQAWGRLPFVFALVDCVGSMIPQLENALDGYRVNHLGELFIRYFEDYEELKAKRERLEKHLVSAAAAKNEAWVHGAGFALVGLGACVVIYVVLGILGDVGAVSARETDGVKRALSSLFVAYAVVIIVVEALRTRRMENASALHEDERRLSQEDLFKTLDTVNCTLRDTYETYAYAHESWKKSTNKNGKPLPRDSSP